MSKTWRKIFPDAQRAQAEFLLDGEATFAAMKAAIKRADSDEHYIYILGWMLDIDFPLTHDSSETLFDLLKTATDKGVEVRGLIWDNPLYEKGTGKALLKLKDLKRTKLFTDPHTYYPEESNRFLKVLTETARRLILALDNVGVLRPALDDDQEAKLREYFGLLNRPWGTFRNLGAHHEKILVVKGRDGLVGFCGGLDLNPNRVITKVKGKETRLPAYHDTACQVHGQAALGLLFKFRIRWENHPAARSTPLRGKTEALPTPPPSGTYAPYTQVVGTYNPPKGGRVQRDRSARQAYLDVIENAEVYIYIEDQYMVSHDIATRLKTKIREPGFKYLTLVMQQASETADMLIPNRKRAEFLDILLGGASEDVRKKVAVCVIDKARWEHDRYHPGLHSKVLIADDTLAIIGSPNISRRSFTLDSETSVVLFDEDVSKQSFALRFRQATWKEFSKRKDVPATYQHAWSLPLTVKATDQYILSQYTAGDVEDVDVAVKKALRSSSVTGVLSNEIDPLFFNLWEHAIDAWVDD
jgi:phosphatidylserine/phosphatidylglycerophosphate/cardiolipin synthase-like enzyme